MDAAMLAIPRPRTRGECLEEARPCPWVGCSHHLLLEVMASKGTTKRSRPPKLVLNRPNAGRSKDGRRSGLPSYAAAALVETWIDDAVEWLSWMEHTCSLDVADDEPDGLDSVRTGELLGITHQSVAPIEARALAKRRVRDTLRLASQG